VSAKREELAGPPKVEFRSVIAEILEQEGCGAQHGIHATSADVGTQRPVRFRITSRAQFSLRRLRNPARLKNREVINAVLNAVDAALETGGLTACATGT